MDNGLLPTNVVDDPSSRHKGSRRIIRDRAPMQSIPPSNDNDSMKPNIGEEVRSRSPSGHTPIPESTRSPGKGIDDIGKLTLGQERTAPSSPETEQGGVPSTSPTHREKALPITESYGQPADDHSVAIMSLARHSKTQSGGPFSGKQLEPYRERPATSDPDFARNNTGSNKRLFDPERDSPFSNPVVRKNKRMQDPKYSVNQPAMACVDLRDYQVRPGLEPGDSNPQKADRPDRNSPSSGQDESGTAPRDQPTPSPSSQGFDLERDTEMDMEPILLLQPETRPISHDQLVVEVKGIYAGLVMVESKCVDVDEKQLKAALEKDQTRQTKLSNEQWQALIHLHKTLLHEHHDFFLASQHPSASPALSDLAGKYSMPYRMWRHAIYAFLEVLRHRLPESRDHMLAFIYIAYSMMALLYETVPTFEDTWVECLGDLGRYRMAVEVDDPWDREIWSGVARFWYIRATDNNPGTGRLYHRLATLSRQYSLQQLSLYTRSLTCFHPFEGARDSIKTLFNPILNGKAPVNPRSSSFETVFVKAHGILFYGASASQYEAAVRQIEDGLLDNYIGLVTSKFKELGVCATITNIGAIFEYGALRRKDLSKSVFRLAYEEVHRSNVVNGKVVAHLPSQTFFDLNGRGNDRSQLPPPPIESLIESLTRNELQSSIALISQASKLTFSMLAISLRRLGDRNVYPLVHVSLVFLFSLARVDKAMKYVEQEVPWGEICSFLNSLAKPDVLTSQIWATNFPRPENAFGRPLPEDFAMRGQLYTQGFFPETWFSDAMIDDEERSLELPSMAAPRVERILWLGARIVSVCTILSASHRLAGYLLTQTSSVDGYPSTKGSNSSFRQIPQSILQMMPRLRNIAKLQRFHPRPKIISCLMLSRVSVRQMMASRIIRNFQSRSRTQNHTTVPQRDTG